jgi:hypothetical protein
MFVLGDSFGKFGVGLSALGVVLFGATYSASTVWTQYYGYYRPVVDPIVIASLYILSYAVIFLGVALTLVAVIRQPAKLANSIQTNVCFVQEMWLEKLI